MTVGPDASTIHIHPSGVFDIAATGKTWGGEAPDLLSVQNDGNVMLSTNGTATIISKYVNAGSAPEKGRTILKGKQDPITQVWQGGTLKITGSYQQTSGSAQTALYNNSTLEVTNGIFGLRNGQLIGDGFINCFELSMGFDPTQPGFVATNPFIMPGSPGGNGGVGSIYVNGRLRMFAGELYMEIAGAGQDPNGIYRYDRIVVSSEARLSDNFGGTIGVKGGKLIGHLLPGHDPIAGGTRIPVLSYASRINDFVQVNTPAANWGWDKNGNEHWFYPTQDIAYAPGKVGGKVFRDDGAVAGVFEPGVEALLSGITVRLRDESGANILATTTTGAGGLYEFNNLNAGLYTVEFVRPNGERFTLMDQGSDDSLDSDADQITGRVFVPVYDEVVDVFAGLYANTNPVANNDSFLAHKNTPISGNVLPNDIDADGDALAVSLIASPTNGSLILNSDGSFTYTPNTNFSGQDTFVYRVEDGYDGTSSASVFITVSNTAPPVGVNDSYSATAEFFVEAANGVLANDTNPNNDTLTAVLVGGPANGALELNSDGSFLYTPNDDFVGADSFTYRPHDDDGPGTLATVSITVSDHPPDAVDDSASTNTNTPVAINVLANDTDVDEDELTVIGASDGIYGSTTVNVDGTVTYTPPADWSGTDWFTYVVDDGYGRLDYATVTVTVTAVPGTVTGKVWKDLNENGLQDGGIETGFGRSAMMDPIGPEPGISGIQVWLLDADDTVIATTFTDVNGYYTFTGVAPGQYKVRVDTTGYTVSPKDQGLDDGIDSDIFGSGYSDLFTLNPGGLFDIDAGLYLP